MTDWSLLQDVFLRILELEALPCGRQITGDKAGYYERHPDHDVFFNACIFVKVPDRKHWWNYLWPQYGYHQVWYGDLDLTLDSPALERVAYKRQETLYATRERYRFTGLTKKLLKENDGSVRVYEPSIYG